MYLLFDFNLVYLVYMYYVYFCDSFVEEKNSSLVGKYYFLLFNEINYNYIEKFNGGKERDLSIWLELVYS